jgi:hypothetical protein
MVVVCCDTICRLLSIDQNKKILGGVQKNKSRKPVREMNVKFRIVVVFLNYFLKPPPPTFSEEEQSTAAYRAP